MSFDPRLPDDSVNVSSGSAAGEAIWLVSGVVGCAVAAVTLLALGIDVAVRLLPPGVEARVFDEWAAPDLGPDGETEAPDPRQRSVQALLERMAGHWPEAPYRFRAAVVEAPEPNAFALPGGWVVVTTGLLDRIHTENELAFVLGHELGHFRNRDHLRGLGRGVAWGIVSAALGLGEGAASALARVAGGLSNRHFDRDQESEADEVGLELLVAEYGHAGGSAAVFATVLADEAEPGEGDSPADGQSDDESGDDSFGDAVDWVTGWVATHPGHGNRIERLQALAAERGWPTEGTAVDWPGPGDAAQGTAGPE